MAASKMFMDAVKARRSIYAVTDKSPIADAKIEELVKDTMLNAPSAFNSQTTRVALLLHKSHREFWQMTSSVLETKTPADAWKEKVAPRMKGFEDAYGTVVFFEDDAAIKQWAAGSGDYGSLFEGWSEHSSGMHQYIMWTALEAEGFGASLQHYHYAQGVEDKVKEKFSFPKEWVMKAELVFGAKKDPNAPPAKDKKPLEETTRMLTKQD